MIRHLLSGRGLAVFTLACAIVAAPALAETLVLNPVKDNTLFEEDPALSNGSGQHLFAGKIAFGPRRRALLQFRLPSPALFPAGAQVTDVRLRLAMSKTIAPQVFVTVHPLHRHWGEAGSDAPGAEGAGAQAMPGDATWRDTFFEISTWDRPGGDYEFFPIAWALVGEPGFYTFEELPGMRREIMEAMLRPGRNFGWILIGDESSNATAKRFDSREHPDPERRPQLIIEYTLPAGSPPEESIRPSLAPVAPARPEPGSGAVAPVRGSRLRGS
ncbi:hypothetical protein ABI59_06995 [Acidobacteria bacterium Mor1]|nr:hypothetical protein ABI59_06995 [Acidobacteria bacterium Mor1]